MFREGGRKDARMSLSLLLVSLRDSRLGSTSVAGKSALGLLLLFTSQCITFEGGGLLNGQHVQLHAVKKWKWNKSICKRLLSWLWPFPTSNDSTMEPFINDVPIFLGAVHKRCQNFFGHFWYPPPPCRNFSPDLPNHYLVISCNIANWNPPPA